MNDQSWMVEVRSHERDVWRDVRIPHPHTMTLETALRIFHLFREDNAYTLGQIRVVDACGVLVWQWPPPKHLYDFTAGVVLFDRSR